MKLIFFLALLIGLHHTTFALEWFDEDFKKKNIYDVTEKLTDKTSLALFAAGATSVMFTQKYDSEGRDNWNNNQQMSYPISSAGDIIGSGIGSGIILLSQYYFDTNSNNWQNHARSIVWETIAVTTMKYSFGKQRPNNKNYVSFPSGHTAISFATATSLTYAYGYKAGLIAYPVATLVGLSRMSDNMHWVSDVVGGAFVGFIMARASQSDNAESDFSIVPIYHSEGFEITLSKNF